MSRIVVTTLGTLGDLHPVIAIALELRQRGHKLKIRFSTTLTTCQGRYQWQPRPNHPLRWGEKTSHCDDERQNEILQH
jgi:hypothetical protein